MRRQRAKHRLVPVVPSYRGRWLRWASPCLAALPALPGLVLILIRPLGMRFSGFLLLALAAVLLAEVYLQRWGSPVRDRLVVSTYFSGGPGAGAGAVGHH